MKCNAPTQTPGKTCTNPINGHSDTCSAGHTPTQRPNNQQISAGKQNTLKTAAEKALAAQDQQPVISDYATVGPEAKVTGAAIVTGYATVTDHAVVGGTSEVGDHALVRNYAHVFGEGCVVGNAHVSGRATVYGLVEGDATVTDNVTVSPTGYVTDNAMARHNAQIHGILFGRAVAQDNARVSEGARVGGETVLAGNAHIGKGGRVNSYQDYTYEEVNLYNEDKHGNPYTYPAQITIYRSDSPEGYSITVNNPNPSSAPNELHYYEGRLEEFENDPHYKIDMPPLDTTHRFVEYMKKRQQLDLNH